MLLVVLGLFTELVFCEFFLVACLDPETCSARDQDCNAEVQEHPKLVRLDGVQVGHVQEIQLKEGMKHKLITKSLRPLLFEIPDFLSAEECDHIVKLAGLQGLHESTTLPVPEDEGTAVSDEEKNENCQHLLASDEDSDGKISPSEFAMFIGKEMQMPMNDTDVDLMLQKINFDRDKDGFISKTECLEIDHLAFDRYVTHLEDSHPRQRTRLSQQTWLKVTTDPLLQEVQKRVILLTKLPRVFIERSEDLQVVKYGVHGHYHAHYDSTDERDASVSRCCRGDTGNCSLCRYMTVLYYLNDVTRGGETAFPVADEEDFNQTDYHEKDRSNLSYHCYNASVLVRPRKGTAVMWYNHFVSNVTGLLGAQDMRSLHGGCDVLEGYKWIANNWINAPFEWTDQV